MFLKRDGLYGRYKHGRDHYLSGITRAEPESFHAKGSKGHCFEGSLLQRSIAPKGHCSEGSLLRKVIAPKVHCSEGSLLRRRVIAPKVIALKGHNSAWSLLQTCGIEHTSIAFLISVAAMVFPYQSVCGITS